MAIDNSFIIKKLQGLPEMFVIFSQSTKHPYVTCNEESFDDQIHIFSDAEAAHAYVVAKNEQEKIPVVSVRVAAEQFLHFYGTLYALGVNGVVLHDNDTETSLALEAIVHRRHNPDELPEKTASCHQSGADAHFPVFPAGDASSGQRGRKRKS